MSDPVKCITVCSIIDNSMVLDVGHLAEGVCETPLVHDDFDVGGESKGAVLGACRWHDQAVIENLFVGAMDVILTAG